MPSLSELKEIAEKGIKNEVDAISYMNYFNCDVTKAMIELCEIVFTNVPPFGVGTVGTLPEIV